ncbi:MAG: CBS domain-containing protein [Gaiellaceae bacterium]
MRVREALLHPRVLGEDAPARDAAELLTRPSVESVLVVGDGDRLLGCVTKGAVVAAVAAGRDVGALRARDLCDPDVTTVGPDASLDEALHLMAEHGLERLAVTEDGRLLGVLPRESLVRRIAEDEPA